MRQSDAKPRMHGGEHKTSFSREEMCIMARMYLDSLPVDAESQPPRGVESFNYYEPSGMSDLEPFEFIVRYDA